METIPRYLKLTTLLFISFLSITIFSQSNDSLIVTNRVTKFTISNINNHNYFILDSINILYVDNNGSNFNKIQYLSEFKNMDFSKYGYSFSVYNKTLNLNDNYIFYNNEFIHLNSNNLIDNSFGIGKDSFNPYGVTTIKEGLNFALIEDNPFYALTYILFNILN